MRLVGKLFGGLVLLLILGLGIASVVFWFRPVGVNNYLNKLMLQQAIQSPELLTNLAFLDNTPLDFHSGKLGDYTRENEQEQLAKLKKSREVLNQYGPEGLDGQELLSWEIMAWFLDDIIRQSEFDHSGYRVNQISGVTVNLPSFLTDQHQIVSKKSSKRYVSRLNDFGRVLGEVKARVEEDRAAGVVPPDFVIEKSIAGMRNFIEGGAAESPLVTTFSEKLDKLEGLSAQGKEALLADAKAAVSEQVIPGYEAMIALFEEMQATATHDAGIWRIPNGDAIYRAALKSNTTTDFTANDVHQTGLSEVDRIEVEMDAILVDQGLTEGTVSERVRILMEDPAQQFPNTDEGREQMIAYLVELNDQLMEKAGDYFITLPPQPLEILRIPEFSEDSAPGGYYQQPAIDGSRPGRFYINQKDTADNPKWTLPTLMYHEGAPGHHFQISAQMLIKDVPMVRKFPLFTSYTEGWALYGERIAKTDMGMYDDDPLGDLGRLQAEMFRAVRLVVDTGMHAKKWSREEAIEYMVSKTGMTEAEVTREIERYVVWPAQATSYKTGQLAMLRFREKAETELGDDFDLREYHELILMNGAMPLGILDRVIDEWIAEQKEAA
ncbi:MAG: DUF885 domain-containing protein [Pseudomonadota bacterium]